MSSFADWLVRLDYTVAGVLLVLAPLVLSILTARDTTVRRRMLTYWRASSILLISLFLLVHDQEIGHVTALVGFVAIPVALWIGDAVYTLPPTSLPRGGPLRRSYTSWRWFATVYCGAGLVLSLLALFCTMELGFAAFCQTRDAATSSLGNYLHPDADPQWIVIPSYIAAGLYLVYAFLSVKAVLRQIRSSPF